MLYIHKLNQLAPKAADLESVYLMRELKQKTPLPINEAKLHELLAEFLVSDTDKTLIDQALPLIEPTIQKVDTLTTEKNDIHESANLVRTAQILREIPLPLQNSLLYVYDISNWQKQFLTEITPLLNSLNKLRANEDKIRANEKLKEIFRKILRNDDFGFKFIDIINEGQVAQIQGLIESIDKGFLFHYTLEEELKKISFADIKRRIPANHLEEAETIRHNVLLIQKGVERAYQVNMRMVNMSIILFSYIKWLTAPI